MFTHRVPSLKDFAAGQAVDGNVGNVFGLHVSGNVGFEHGGLAAVGADPGRAAADLVHL